jgi:hypothetical protein
MILFLINYTQGVPWIRASFVALRLGLMGFAPIAIQKATGSGPGLPSPATGWTHAPIVGPPWSMSAKIAAFLTLAPSLGGWNSRIGPCSAILDTFCPIEPYG